MESGARIGMVGDLGDGYMDKREPENFVVVEDGGSKLEDEGEG